MSDIVRNSQNILPRIFDMQTKMNQTVNKDWINAKYNWHTAIIVEGAEFIDHLGWKWWKKTESNYEQAFIELVDILHFVVSSAIVNGIKYSDILYNKEYVDPFAEIKYCDFKNKDSLINEMKRFMAETTNAFYSCSHHVRAIVSLINMASLMGYRYNDLFEMYIAKNVLNMARQKLGYKEGTYIKEWDGKEDNVHLMDIIKNNPQISSNPELLMDLYITSYNKGALGLEPEVEKI